MGDALPQAVGIAVSPIPVVLLILVLVSRRPHSGGLAFTLGWTLAVFGIAAVAFVLSSGANVDTASEAAEGGGAVLLGFGLLFSGLAIREWRRRPKPGVEWEPPRILSVVDTLSPPKVLGLGFAAAVANPVNLPLAISAGIVIAQAGATIGQGMFAVVVFTLMASSTVLIPIAIFLLLGDRTRRPLDSLKSWLVANNSTILMILFSVLAAATLGSGLNLFGQP